MWTDDVERVTASELGDLTALSIDELRSFRDDCRQVEDKVSYLRRLAQGRLDIVGAELRRRSEGTASADLPTLVDELPGILSDRFTPTGPGRLPSSLAPPDDDDLTDELDRAAPAGVLGVLGDQTTEAVQTLAESLADFERRVSSARRALFDRIDALQAELTRRYKTGEVNVSSVLK